MIAALAACSPEFHQAAPPPVEPTDRTQCELVDCYVPPPAPLPPACPLEPCIADVAAARATRESAPDVQLGYSLAVVREDGAPAFVAAGAPGLIFDFGATSTQVQLWTLPDLQYRGAWLSGSAIDVTGIAVDTADVDGDGRDEIAVGRPFAHNRVHDARVQVLDADVTGEVFMNAASRLTILADVDHRIGLSLAFGDEAELWVAVNHVAGGDGRVLAFSADENGFVHEEDATHELSSPTESYDRPGAWDGDHDGRTDLVAQAAKGMVWFRAPWRRTHIDEPDGEWLDPLAEDWDLGQVHADVGDLDGDGASDLAFAATTYSDPAYRAGRVWLATEAPGTGLAADLPIQIRGQGSNERLGWGLAGADVDGDGQNDLVTTAYTVAPLPEWHGTLLVFRGPLQPGVHLAAEADARVYSEYPGDDLFRGVAAADVDGDSQQDLVLGAPGYPNGRRDGAVYLVTGSAIFP